MTTETSTVPAPTPTQTPTRADAKRAADALFSAATDPSDNLVTKLKVAQYVEWRARFDDMQRSAGPAAVTNSRVFYDIDDETTLVILSDVADVSGATAWAQGGWRAALPATDRETPPAIYFGTAPDQIASNARLAAHFTVNDYPKWHQLFKEMEASRVRSGITGPQVFRSCEDGADVFVMWNIADTELVRAWVAEDILTGYPAATGAANNTARFLVELGSAAGQEAHRGN